MSHEYAKRMQAFEARLLDDNTMSYSERRISGVGEVSLIEHGYLDALQADLYTTTLSGIVSIEKSLQRLIVILKDKYGQSISRNALDIDEIEQSLSGAPE